MDTQIARTENEETTHEVVKTAVEELQKGNVVALPTETVYGLAADAFNPEAVAKIFEAKDRPRFDPLIVHVASQKALREVADVPEELRKIVRTLTELFWPGPLTLILPKNEKVPDIVSAGLPTIGVRCSKHPLFAEILESLGRPLAAPSANRFGRISPTSADAVMSELEGRIPLIVDGGACARGLESTIVRVKVPEKNSKGKAIIQILRHGPISADELKRYGKIEVVSNDEVSDNAPEAPGLLASHYAPQTPLRLLKDPKDFKAEAGKSYGLLSYRGKKKDGYLNLHPWDEIEILSPGSGKTVEAALRFFFILRKLDELGVDEIIAEPVSEFGAGAAIMERLQRASVK
ncbi:MAG: threonylcarbamoyl-AMP synthase [Verrucomicrobiales bacterium]|nr:threonylcarbamoyl-AMP synthase [Verrucomicrobiales bacterium]